MYTTTCWWQSLKRWDSIYILLTNWIYNIALYVRPNKSTWTCGKLLVHTHSMCTLMNTRKRVGDRTPPWVTPWRRRIFLLLSWSRLTRARLLNRYEWIHLSMQLKTPLLISLTMRPSIHTLSNARCMSIQATQVIFFSFCVNWFIDAKCGLLCVVCLSPPAVSLHRWIAQQWVKRKKVFPGST